MTDLLDLPYFDADHNPTFDRVHAVYDPVHRRMDQCVGYREEQVDDIDIIEDGDITYIYKRCVGEVKHYLIDMDIPEGEPVRTYHTRLCGVCLMDWTTLSECRHAYPDRCGCKDRITLADKYDLRLDPEFHS